MHHDDTTPDDNPIPEGMKRCTQCARTLRVSMFSRDSQSRDGLKPACAECRAEKKRRYREANKEKLAEQERRYREANKGKRSKSQRRVFAGVVLPGEKGCLRCNTALPISMFSRNCRSRDGYRSECKQCERTMKQRYRQANRIKRIEYDKCYRQANPDIARAHRRDRRARKRANGGHISPAEWRSVLARFNGKCAKCGSPDNIHMDHVVPLAKGGKHSVDNVQPLCATCNLRKHTKIEDYRGKFYEPLALPLDDAARAVQDCVD